MSVINAYIRIRVCGRQLVSQKPRIISTQKEGFMLVFPDFRRIQPSTGSAEVAQSHAFPASLIFRHV